VQSAECRMPASGDYFASTPKESEQMRLHIRFVPARRAENRRCMRGGVDRDAEPARHGCRRASLDATRLLPFLCLPTTYPKYPCFYPQHITTHNGDKMKSKSCFKSVSMLYGTCPIASPPLLAGSPTRACPPRLTAVCKRLVTGILLSPSRTESHPGPRQS
jgi:hypothetical protein